MYVFSLLAQESNSSSGGAGSLASLGLLLLIPVAMYFLMIRPQRRKMREQQAMQSSLEVGDEVMTASGIYGFITGFEDDRVWVEIDDDVQIRVQRAYLSGKVSTSGTASASATANDDAGDAASPAATTPATSAASTKPTVKGLRGRKADAPPADAADDNAAE